LVNKYTIVSAVYNTAEYLDSYFQSIINQSLDFQSHIQIILVNDGSTDNSESVIQQWQSRYPENILYLKQPNSGVATARSLGLSYAKSDWITFIDSDDFIDEHYFKEVNSFLEKNIPRNLSMVSCNFIFYFEEEKKYSDSHYLNYRFKKSDEYIVDTDAMQGQIQISINSAFFRRDLIVKHNLDFNKKTKASFSDGEFTMRYMLHTPSYLIAFLSKPRYYYRKRGMKNSIIDTVWKNPHTYDNTLEVVCLGVLKDAKRLRGRVPVEIQRIILYHLMWHIKKIVNKPEFVGFLTEKQINRYKQLLREIFVYIEAQTIDEFELAGCQLYHKVGIMGMLKHEILDPQRISIEWYDSRRRKILLRYFTYHPHEYIFRSSRHLLSPLSTDIQEHVFLGELFVYEYKVTIDAKEMDILSVDHIDKLIIFQVGKKLWRMGISLHEIEKYVPEYNHWCKAVIRKRFRKLLQKVKRRMKKFFFRIK